MNASHDASNSLDYSKKYKKVKSIEITLASSSHHSLNCISTSQSHLEDEVAVSKEGINTYYLINAAMKFVVFDTYPSYCQFCSYAVKCRSHRRRK